MGIYPWKPSLLFIHTLIMGVSFFIKNDTANQQVSLSQTSPAAMGSGFPAAIKHWQLELISLHLEIVANSTFLPSSLMPTTEVHDALGIALLRNLFGISPSLIHLTNAYWTPTMCVALGWAGEYKDELNRYRFYISKSVTLRKLLFFLLASQKTDLIWSHTILCVDDVSFKEVWWR